ncbi:hypothetical protein, partial [Mesorhizobium sp. M0910]|uniref:hypothetical protein n=1 Tax=Mesorhizobium sp. M0910 TaxID=2957025 RepID=UPI00333B0F81
MGLIFLGAGTLAAAVTQFAIQSTAGQQSTITNWTEPLPGHMEGRASVIDGDTVIARRSGRDLRDNLDETLRARSRANYHADCRWQGF